MSGVEGVRHLSSSITGRPVGDDDPVRAGNQHRPRAERRPRTPRHAGAAPTCRRTSTSRLVQRVDVIGLAHRHLCGDLAGRSARAACLVRGRRRQARAARRAQRRQVEQPTSAASSARFSSFRSIPIACQRRRADRRVDIQPPPARHQRRSRRRTGRDRQNDQGHSHARRRQDPQRAAARNHDQPAGRRRSAARRSRRRHRHHRRPPDRPRALQRRARGGARHQTFQGRQRRRGRGRRTEAYRRAENRSSRSRSQADRLRRSSSPRATTKRRSRRCSRAPCWPSSSCFCSCSDIRATVIAAISLPVSIFPAFWAMDLLRLFAQPRQLPRHHAVHRHFSLTTPSSRSRTSIRHMRMGKSPYRAALEAADRDWPRRPLQSRLTIIADLRARQFHVGNRRAVFKQFRHHGFGPGVLLAARRAGFANAGAGGLLPSRIIRTTITASPVDGLKPTPRLVTWSVKHCPDHGHDRLRHLRRLDLEHGTAAARPHCRRGTPRARLLAVRAAARLPARLSPRRSPQANRRPPAQTARR